MHDLARGWAIMMAHWHGHHLGGMIAIWMPIWICIWLPMLTARRKKNDEDSKDEGICPKQRTPLPSADRGFRR